MSVWDNVAFGLEAKKVGEATRSQAARRRAARRSCASPTSPTASRASCPAVSSNASRSPARSSTTRARCCSTSRSAALDLKLRQAMQLELKRIQREVGITFVFVTHDQEEALTMSDRIAVMSEGRVEQIGAPEEIYDQPASVFVAGFIGMANLLPGRGRVRRAATPRRSTSRALGSSVPSAADAAAGRRRGNAHGAARTGDVSHRRSPPNGHVGAAVHREGPRVPGTRRPGRAARPTTARDRSRTSVPTSELPMLRPGDTVWALGPGTRGRCTPGSPVGSALDTTELDCTASGRHHEVPVSGTARSRTP